MIITIGGKAGAWKSTCTHLLAEQLWYEIISIGNIKRKLAEDMWLSIEEFNLLGETKENIEKFDHQYEEYQKSLPLDSKVILDSRLSYRCQPKALHVFLDVEENVGAQRVFMDKRTTDNHWSVEETIRQNKTRNIKEWERYMRLYNTNPRDLSNYDLIIDTTHLTPQQVIEKITTTLSLRNIK